MRGARWLLFAVCVVAAFSGLAVPAGAHAVLERSAPAGGAVLGSSPGVVAMVFDEPVGISLARSWSTTPAVDEWTKEVRTTRPEMARRCRKTSRQTSPRAGEGAERGLIQGTLTPPLPEEREIRY